MATKAPFLSHLLSSLPLVSDSISKLFSSTACLSCSDNLKETRGGEGKKGQEDRKEEERRRGGESELGDPAIKYSVMDAIDGFHSILL